MAFLYIRPDGKPHRKHSYSAGTVADHCLYKYYLQRILGWREINNFARFEFGKAFETAIQYYHENQADLAGSIAKFDEMWAPFQTTELVYTKVEKDWYQCRRIAVDWLKLYSIRQPNLPIPIGGHTLFQKEFSKEVFPNDPNYGEIEDLGKLDIVSFVEPGHPMLPKLDWKVEYGAFRPLVVDIKTSGKDFPEQYGMAAFDAQLRRYSWLTGIRDVALLWFVKKSPTVQKGYSVTLLEDTGYMKAGAEAVVAQVTDEGIWLLANDTVIEEMEKVQGHKNGKIEQTKEAKARRDAWLAANGTFAYETSITKQRLQFNAGFVTTQSAEDAGKIAGNQIVKIVNAWHTKTYPNTFGVRFPHDDTNDPYFRAFVLNDEMYRNQSFTKADEGTLDDLFKEEDDENE
jgi:hypothetical protein